MWPHVEKMSDEQLRDRHDALAKTELFLRKLRDVFFGLGEKTQAESSEESPSQM